MGKAHYEMINDEEPVYGEIRECRIILTMILAGSVLASAGLVSVFAQGTLARVSELKPEPTDPAQKALRAARDRLFQGLRPVEQWDPNAPPPSVVVDMPGRPELPVDDSDAVVLGSVTDAQPFLSKDRRAIYTEYTIQIGEMLKAPSQFGGTVKELALVESGGAVRLPSGRIVKYDVRGYGILPEVGGRYMFFLKYYPLGDCFRLVKCWRLWQGRSIAQSEEDLGRVAQHKSMFQGMNETSFIEAVRQTIRR